ncbi:hypothetical protein ACTFIU_011130 [Dictyostelium citrinum]
MDTDYDESSFRLLAFSILECNFEVSKVILLQFSNINDGSFNDEQLKRDIDNQCDLEYYDNLYKIIDPLENSVFIRDDISFQDVYLVCDELIKLKQRLSIKFKNSSFNSIHLLFKHLYIIGLQCFDAKLINIVKLNQLFQRNSIDHCYNSIPNFFKIFFYLYQKSWKLSNYFLSRVKKFNFTYSNLENYNNFFSLTINNNNNNPTNSTIITEDLESQKQKKQQNEELLSLELISKLNFEELFLLLRRLINNYIDSEEDSIQKEDFNSKFKTRFYFDMQYLINIKESSTIINVLKEIQSDGFNLKKINYLGFLVYLDITDGDDFSSKDKMDISGSSSSSSNSSGNNDLELFKSIVSLKLLKNRLLLEFALEKLRLDLVKFILSTCKVKRINEDLLKSIFSCDEYIINHDDSNNENNNNFNSSSQDIAEFLLKNHYELICDSLLTSKFSIFTMAFLQPNLYLCKLIMRLHPIFVEIKVDHIKQNVLNGNIRILEYFYQIGSNILKSRIKRILLKYGNKKSIDWL